MGNVARERTNGTHRLRPPQPPRPPQPCGPSPAEQVEQGQQVAAHVGPKHQCIVNYEAVCHPAGAVGGEGGKGQRVEVLRGVGGGRAGGWQGQSQGGATRPGVKEPGRPAIMACNPRRVPGKLPGMLSGHPRAACATSTHVAWPTPRHQHQFTSPPIHAPSEPAALLSWVLGKG